jgi:hypothetical protein
MCLISWNLGMGLSRSVQGLKKNYLSNSMDQRPPWKASTCFASHKIPKTVWNLKVKDWVHKSPTLSSGTSARFKAVISLQCSKTTKLLPGEHVNNTSNPPNWKSRVHVLVWNVTQNWCSMGGPNSGYVAASRACEFTDAYNLSHPAKQASHKVEIQLRWYTSPLAVPTAIQIQSTPSHPISLTL